MKGWVGICRFGGIGDNLVVASVLRPLKRLGYMVEVITSPHAHVVYLNNPFVDKLTVKADGEVPGGDIGTQWFRTRANEYDQFHHMSYSMEVRHGLQQAQTSYWWRPEYRRKLCAGSYLETAHDIVGVPHEFGPTFFPTEDEYAHARTTRERYCGKKKCVAWIVSGSRLDKVHPYSAMVIARLIKELGVVVMMFGAGQQQFDHAKTIEERVKRQNSGDDGLLLGLSPDNADPGGERSWHIRRSITQCMVADIVVSPDTGFAWAVSMERIPKVIMVSHASVENITKHWINTDTLHADPVRVPCWPCHRLHNDFSTCVPAPEAVQAASCMHDISVDTIIASVAKGLGL